jgi:hypothetical protein
MKSGPSKKRRRRPKQESRPQDLSELTHDELSGPQHVDEDLASSGTGEDEDEDEATGDGKIGRSRDDLLG